MAGDGGLTELRRGVLGPCVLALLELKPRFGLELVRDLAAEDGLLTSDGTVYPLLNRLRDAGLVTSQWQDNQGERARRYYSITEAGRQRLTAFRAEWDQFSGTVARVLSHAAKAQDYPRPRPRAWRGADGPLMGRLSSMTTEDRVTQLERQINELQAHQADLRKQLAQAQLDQWRARIEDLELQMHLAAVEANDKLTTLMSQLRDKWADTRRRYDEGITTASSVADTMRTGLDKAIEDLRTALLESKDKLR